MESYYIAGADYMTHFAKKGWNDYYPVYRTKGVEEISSHFHADHCLLQASLLIQEKNTHTTQTRGRTGWLAPASLRNGKNGNSVS